MRPIESLGETLQQALHEFSQILHLVGETLMNGCHRLIQTGFARINHHLCIGQFLRNFSDERLAVNRRQPLQQHIVRKPTGPRLNYRGCR